MELLNQIQNEIQMWKDFMETKRDIFRERLINYVDQNIDDEKISVNTNYAMMNLWLSIRYSDKTSVVVLPKKFWDTEYAANLTDLAWYDYDETERKRKKHQIDFDSQFFGYAIEKNIGWDEYRKVIDTEIRDPLTRICDPYSDHLTKPRFHYFEVEMLKSDMTAERGFDENAVEELTSGWIEDIRTNKTYRNEAAWLNDVVEDTSEDFYIDVYDGVRYKDWNLYIVTVDANMGKILREEEVEPVTKEEKKQWVDIRTQVIITYYSPIRWNPCGISLLDMTNNKQKNSSILANLRLIDAKFSTFGQMNLVNTDVVKNTSELLKPSTNTKWIWVNAWAWSLSNAVYPVPRQSIMQDSYNVSSEMSRQLQVETWMSENTLWVADKNITLWQSQQVQANANLRLALWIAISNWGEEDYWKFMWLRGYEEYFETSDVKFIRIANWFDSMPIEFRRDDFAWIESPDIKIVSRQQAEQEREQEKISFLAMMPYFTEDPTIPKVIKTLAIRYAMGLQWTPREKIKILTYNPDEEAAKQKLIFINNEDMRWAIVDNMSDDHQTFLTIFEWARDSSIKDKAIQNRKDALVASGQLQAQTAAWLEQSGWWQVNAMQSQMTSNLISQDSNKIKNTWNIAQSV